MEQPKKEKDVAREGDWIFEKDIRSACLESDAIIILTEWNEYTKINWENAYKIMRKPACF